MLNGSWFLFIWICFLNTISIIVKFIVIVSLADKSPLIISTRAIWICYQCVLERILQKPKFKIQTQSDRNIYDNDIHAIVSHKLNTKFNLLWYLLCCWLKNVIVSHTNTMYKPHSIHIHITPTQLYYQHKIPIMSNKWFVPTNKLIIPTTQIAF